MGNSSADQAATRSYRWRSPPTTGIEMIFVGPEPLGPRGGGRSSGTGAIITLMNIKPDLPRRG
ncbi:MAG: hypothetical protein O7H41_14325 [Planctomycetota bacterium]|nr:hypothetical protein [Planctomycetota bacterium]